MKLKQFECVFVNRMPITKKEMRHNIFVLGVLAGTYYASKGHEQQMVDACDELESFGLSKEDVCTLLEKIEVLREEIKLANKSFHPTPERG